MFVIVLGAVTALVVYEPPRSFGEFVAWVVGIAALVTATSYLFRHLRRLFQLVERIHALTSRELEPSEGPQGDATMKDDLHGVAVALGRLQRRVDRVEADLRAIYDPLHRSKARNDMDAPEHRREDI